MGPAARTAETVVMAVAWTCLVFAMTVVILTIPAVTRTLVDWLDVSQACELTPAETRQAAEAVRAFVSSARAEDLPGTIAGRDAFDESAIEHLVDVRGTLSGARTTAGLSALVLAVWIGVAAARRRWDAVGRAVEAGGWTTLGLMLAAGIFAVLGFDRAFTAFHGIFFEPGTWQFPAESLLIQLFPESFWVSMGALAAALAGLGGAILVAAGRRLRTRSSN